MSYLDDRRNFINSGRPEKEKVRKPLKKISDKLAAKRSAAKEARGEDETELEKWFNRIMVSEKAVCWETGEPINKHDVFGWHGSIAHVLPKSDFPSVKTHPKNYLILKMWGGTHGQYDASWEKAAQMKIWPYACKIFNLLYPLLTREEKSKLPDVILQEIKPEVILGVDVAATDIAGEAETGQNGEI